MSTSSTPYWPGDTNSQYFQNLGYNSTTNVLTLSPFGNSVSLATPSSGGSFSTLNAPQILTSSIGTNVKFTGNATLVGTNTFTAPNISVSSLTVSSINGIPYTSGQATQTALYGFTYSLPSQTPGSGISTLSTFNSPVYAFNDFWSYTGPMTFLATWNGSGNTNNLQNTAQTGPASFYRQINISTTQTGGEVGEVLHVLTTGNSLSGSFGPKSVPSTFQITNGTGTIIPASVQLNGAGGSFYTGPGAEANVTVYGAGQVIIQDSLDWFVSSGDPGASYAFSYNAPVNAANTSNTSAVITWR